MFVAKASFISFNESWFLILTHYQIVIGMSRLELLKLNGLSDLMFFIKMWT